MEVEVGAELKATVRVWDCERSLDVVRDRFGGRVREIVHRQNKDVIADADPAVLAPVTQESGVYVDHFVPRK